MPCRGGAGEGEHIQFSQEDFLGFGASGKRGCSARPASSLTLSRSPEHTVWRPAGAAIPGAASKSILSGRAGLQGVGLSGCSLRKEGGSSTWVERVAQAVPKLRSPPVRAGPWGSALPPTPGWLQGSDRRALATGPLTRDLGEGREGLHLQA